MALHLHDPNNHAPPVSAMDVWDDGGEQAHPARATGGVMLPTKRARIARAAAASPRHDLEPHDPAAQGLRIDVRRPARNVSTAAEQVPVKEYGGAVVKLEQVLAEAPFQAAKVIPALEMAVPEESRETQGEGQDWGKSRHLPLLRWLMIAGTSVGGVIVAAMATQELMLAPKPKPPASHLEVVEESKVVEILGFELDGPSEATARSLLAAYAKATTPEEVAPLIRDAARLTPRLSQDWQPWHAPADWLPARSAEWQISADGGKPHGRLSGRRPDFTPYRVYFVREGEALRVDWEASEGLSSVAFATLERGVGTGGIIRAYVAAENFYSQAFPESEYHSYKLLAPDRELVIWGYLKLDSPAAPALLKVFESAARDETAPADLPITLRLIPPPKGAQKNQWLIGEMLHIDWVSP